MLILLDTHVLVWLVAQPERLSKPAASAIRRARASDGLSIADVTVWEVASLCARGTLQIHRTVENTVQDLLIHSAGQVKPITPEIAALATQFPNDYPHDLVDR